MNNRLPGAILLITGTAIGAGMLALPVATSECGFLSATLLLILCWAIMTAGGLLMLEVTLRMPRNANLISMAGKTLGPAGQLGVTGLYLLLLYSLLAAYIAGGADLLQNCIALLHVNLPKAISAFLFASLLGIVVFRGIFAVDFFNRGLMALKFLAFFLLAGLLMPHVNGPWLLKTGNTFWHAGSITVAITSFGFSTIIPSLRNYLHDDAKKLRLAIIAGSLVPLLCYILWNAVSMGVIPREGSNGLIATLHAGRPASAFLNDLSLQLHAPLITSLARIFTSICMLTSFLGVALCLTDFIADGLQVARTGKNNLLITCAALAPPLLLVIYNPGIFIAALGYAGTMVILLLVAIPALMALRGRSMLSAASRKTCEETYQVAGGSALPCFLLIITALIVILGAKEHFA